MKKPTWIKAAKELERLGTYKDIVKFADLNENDKIIVDLGTGQANLLTEIYIQSPQKRVLIGTDISSNILKHAKRYLSKKDIPSKIYTTSLYPINTKIRKDGSFVDYMLRSYPYNVNLDEVILLEDDYTYSGLPLFLARNLKGSLADKVFLSFQGSTQDFYQPLNPMLPTTVFALLNDEGEFIFYERMIVWKKRRKEALNYFVKELENELGLSAVKAEFDNSDFAQRVVGVSYNYTDKVKTKNRGQEFVEVFKRTSGKVGIVKIKMELKK